MFARRSTGEMEMEFLWENNEGKWHMIDEEDKDASEDI